MASSWTKCNPEDPSTYPEHSERVDLVIRSGAGQTLARGSWNGQYWATDESARLMMNQVTHWQPLPALPGEELAGDEELVKVLDILEAGLADGSPVFGPIVSTALRIGARIEPPDAARKLIAAARRALAVKKAP